MINLDRADLSPIWVDNRWTCKDIYNTFVDNIVENIWERRCGENAIARFLIFKKWMKI